MLLTLTPPPAHDHEYDHRYSRMLTSTSPPLAYIMSAPLSGSNDLYITTDKHLNNVSPYNTEKTHTQRSYKTSPFLSGTRLCILGTKFNLRNQIVYGSPFLAGVNSRIYRPAVRIFPASLRHSENIYPIAIDEIVYNYIGIILP